MPSITDEEEDEETLSLCDLPLYSDQSVDDWEHDLSIEKHDYFEFFSQELDPSTISTTLAPDNIIFCGKLIPYRHPDIFKKDSRIVESTNKKKRIWSLIRSSTSSMEQAKAKNGKNSTTNQDHESPKKIYYKDESEKVNNFKVSILTSSSSGKARWYFYLFGISRFSTKMEWKDIKNRQSRRQYPSLPSPMFRFQNGGNEKVRGSRDGGWKLWGLIRALSCGGNHAKTMAAASIYTLRESQGC